MLWGYINWLFKLKMSELLVQVGSEVCIYFLGEG